jgi:predicted transcriptional regulator
MVQLSEELVSQLDQHAARQGKSRSALIREAIEAYLAADTEREIDALIVEGYRRIPQGGEFDVDEWGDLGAFVTGLAAEQLRRPDEDERGEGLGAW